MNFVPGFARGAGVFALAALTVAAFSQEVSYRIGARQTQQLATVESVTDFETFTGRTDKVTGSIRFDPAKRTGSAKIEIDVASIDTGIALRNEHMLAPNWMDATKHPKITFESTKIEHIEGDRYRVTGNFTMRGVTRPVTVEANVRRMPESQATRNAGFRGDVLQARANFSVKLADFGINPPAQATAKVAQTVRISVTIYGQTGS
jgi:polyisoprenoid-binding protein YceI